MKYRNTLIGKIFLTLSILTISCNVLDQQPDLQIDSSVTITDEASAHAALNGLYDGLQNEYYYGAKFFVNLDMFTEDVINSAFDDSYKQFNLQIIPSTNEGTKQMWLQMYRVVNIANNIIDKVPDLTIEAISDEAKVEITGSAEMIRGMVYLDLLRTFGEHWDLNSAYGVPIRTDPATHAEFTPRSSVAQIYQRILEDLQNAEDKLGDAVNPAYASKMGAIALLARTYLYMRDYQNAKTYANEVINSGLFQLNANYSDTYFINNTKESIFELNFNFQDPSAYLQEYSESKEASIARELFTFFDEGDTRSTLIIEDPDNPNLLTTTKYFDQSDPAYIMRLAEMYFIRAEAVALGDNNIPLALNDLNVIRERAGLAELQVTDVPDEESFINALLAESRKEFYGEGHRFFDLARFRKFNEVYGIDNFRSILPVPYIEILTASGLGETLPQNPGY